MATTIIGSGAPGVPGFQSDDGFTGIELLMGDVPANGAPVDLPFAASTTLPLFAVVGQVGNVATGALALATADGTTVKALGVLMVPVNSGVGVTGTARVHTSGHFNINKLQWGGTFDTEAKKLAAFAVGTSNILLGKNPYDRLA